MHLHLHRAVASFFTLACSTAVKGFATTSAFQYQSHLRSIISHRRYFTSMMMTSVNGGKVVVVGSINQDLTIYSQSLPAPGETLLGTDFVTSAGGKGANQAVAAASIGVVSKENGVHMIGRVGKDDMGRSLLKGLRSKGVCNDEEESMVAGEHTGIAAINVSSDSGQNTIIVAPGANMALSSPDVETSLTQSHRNEDGEEGWV